MFEVNKEYKVKLDYIGYDLNEELTIRISGEERYKEYPVTILVTGEVISMNTLEDSCWLVVSEMPAGKEEVCSCCSRNKDIGSKCWWCGC